MISSDMPVSRREVLRSGIAASALVVAGSGTAAGDDRVEVNVGYSRESGRRAAKDEAEEVLREFNFDALTIRTSEDGADRLRNRGDIRYVEENGTWEALGQSVPWGVDRVDAEVAHADGETGKGADIAIIDTGIDDDHPDLAANVADPSVDANHEAWEETRTPRSPPTGPSRTATATSTTSSSRSSTPTPETASTLPGRASPAVRPAAPTRSRSSTRTAGHST